MKYAEALVQAYNRSLPSSGQLDVIVLPSDTGNDAGLQNAVDAVLSISPEVNADWTASLGWSAVLAVVHGGNPVRNLASSDVRDILLGIDRNWKVVGGQDQLINVYVPDPMTDIGEAFQTAAVPEGRYFGGAELLPASWAVAGSVAADSNGLGFLLCPDVTSNVNILSIDGATPSAENLVNGSYPYRIPLLLSAHQPVPRRISDFAAWAQTEAGQTVVLDLCQAG